MFRKHISNFEDPVRGPHLLIEEAVLLAEKAISEATQCPRSILIAGKLSPSARVSSFSIDFFVVPRNYFMIFVL